MSEKHNGKEVAVLGEELAEWNMDLMKAAKALLSISVPAGQAHMLTGPVSAILKVAEQLGNKAQAKKGKSAKEDKSS